MPWHKASIVGLRKEFVVLAALGDTNLTDLCHRFGIARKTGYKWLRRYQMLGDEGLNDASRRPHHSPTQTVKSIEDLILGIHRKNPSWGGRSIAAEIKSMGKAPVPASTTVQGILSRYRQFENDLVGTVMASRQSSIPAHVLQTLPSIGPRIALARNQWLEFIFTLERKDNQLQKISHYQDLLACIRTPAKASDRKKAIAVLAHLEGFSSSDISRFLGVARKSCTVYIKRYLSNGVKGLCQRKARRRKSENEQLKKKLFSILHSPPSAYGINRTAWKIDDLRTVMTNEKFPVGEQVIREIIRNAGYRWKRARVVLTSTDPEYHEKICYLQSILNGLKDDERFFSIDEYGPFSIKVEGGWALVGPDTEYTVPQWQKSKGSLIITAALELSRNQITHFYSSRKNTSEMICLIQKIISEYSEVRNIYLSWDAASWHVSKRLNQFIEEYNADISLTSRPFITLAPLPARAQFLNVIESVFSGMSRAIIHNSDYQSVAEAKEAIDRYFRERNLNFLENPKRAGKKIWGKERSDTSFCPANNCKDPLYR